MAGLDGEQAAAARANAAASNAEAASRAAHATAVSELPEALTGAGTGQPGVFADGIRETLEDAYHRAEQAAADAGTEEAAAQAFDASIEASLAAMDGRIASLARTSAVGGALVAEAQRLAATWETSSPGEGSPEPEWETVWERAPDDGRFQMVRRQVEPGSGNGLAGGQSGASSGPGPSSGGAPGSHQSGGSPGTSVPNRGASTMTVERKRPGSGKTSADGTKEAAPEPQTQDRGGAGGRRGYAADPAGATRRGGHDG